ncbi:MAG: hypothetical protein AABZ32_00375, partial [Bacteroidota bacterium]
QLWLMKVYRILSPKKIYFFNPFFVKKYEIKKQKTEISRGDLPGGIYFYQLKDKEKIIGTGKVVVNK